MEDLYSISSLPIRLNNFGQLEFKEGLNPVVPGVRKLIDMNEVIRDYDETAPLELYDMYRDVHNQQHKDLIQTYGVRYDITVIKAGKIGKEYIKTAGHYHPMVPNHDISYPEVYEVLSGQATYILQKMGRCAKDIEDVIIVEASKGEKVCIPPNYGHITVNARDALLVMANWVATGWASIYDPIKNTSGAACFVIEDDGQKKISLNSNCNIKSKIRYLKSKDIPEFGLFKDVPMYESFVRNPEKFQFLVKPHSYIHIFDKAFTDTD